MSRRYFRLNHRRSPVGNGVRRLGACLGCAVLFACSGPQTASGQLPGNDNERVAAFLRDPFDPGISGSVQGDERQSVEARFGKPSARAERVAVSPSDPTVTNEYITWEYEGLRFEFFGEVDDDVRYLGSIELFSSNYVLKYGLRVGSTRAEIGKALNVEMPPDGVPYIVTSEYFEPKGDFQVGVFPKLTVQFDKSERAERMVWKYGGH